MDCWHCEKTAVGACRFCGRGVCRTHARAQPFILFVYRSSAKDVTRGLVVDDALWCAACKPRGEAVDLPELR